MIASVRDVRKISFKFHFVRFSTVSATAAVAYTCVPPSENIVASHYCDVPLSPSYMNIKCVRGIVMVGYNISKVHYEKLHTHNICEDDSLNSIAENDFTLSHP